MTPDVVSEEVADPTTQASQSSRGGCLSCVEWLTRKLKLVEEGATPPNWKYIGLVFMALFSSSSTLTFLFPFLPEMMLTLGYSENEKGTSAGLVASSVFAGRIIGSVFWGWLADRKGRKIVLLITISLNGLFAGLFGLSSNIYLAMFFRFMCGAVNGTVGTCKTILYDISDNTNQALGMCMLSISWGTGMILGPAVGGILASPALKWPNVFSEDGVFGQYPYLLPSLFPFVSCALIFFLIFFKFDETFVVKSSKRGDQELTVEEPEAIEENGISNEKTKDLLLRKSSYRASHNSLLQLGQSAHSLCPEAESSAYMAQESTRRRRSSSKELSSLTQRAVSEPELVLKFHQTPCNTFYPNVDESKISHSMFNVSEKEVPRFALRSQPKNVHDIVVPLSSGTNIDMSKSNERKIQKDFLPKQNGNVVRKDEDGLDFDLKKTLTASKMNGTSSVLKTENEEREKLLLHQVDTNGGREIVKVEIVCIEEEKEEENLCECVEDCCHQPCFSACQGSSLHRLARLKDIWVTIGIYSMLSITVIGLEDIFPVFASTRIDYGGLDFSTDEIGIALGVMFIPQMVLQIKLYPFLVSKFGIRKVMLWSVMVCMVFSQCTPMVRVLNTNHALLWACLITVQIPFKMATTCCFAGSSLLINNSVTQDLAGQANGLAMMTTAIGRTFAPISAGALFSWVVTYGPEIGLPFDTSFPFFAIGGTYIFTVVLCLYLSPRLDKQKK